MQFYFIEKKKKIFYEIGMIRDNVLNKFFKR